MSFVPQPAISEETLHALQRDMFSYFLKESNPENGLVLDKTKQGSPASIAVVGFALAAYPIGVERGFMTRAEAVELTLATLRFFWNSPQGAEPDATGYKGFYYHFLDMDTGRRVWDCELSTIDTTFLLAGMLTAAAYFDNESEEEQEIHKLAGALYRRADWRWAQNGGATVSHGWMPESGFLPYRWEGYDEALYFTCSASVQLLTRCLKRATPHGALPTNGKRSTATNFSTAARFFFISFLTCGLIFVAFKIN